MANLDDEYTAIRAEMLRWQDRRFDLIKHSTSVVTSLLGFKLVISTVSSAATGVDHWPLVTALLLLYLSSINVVMWYCGRANAKLAAYLIVFHESQLADRPTGRWEGRLNSLKSKRRDRGNLNTWLTLIQAVLGLLSIVLPWATASFSKPHDPWIGLAIAAGMAFLATLALVNGTSYPRDAYRAYWSSVREEEIGKNSVPADA